ncbi:hypothetical protein GWN28_04800 [candidate division KSB1 bacterium]|nr:hypothetical protein [Phycisphaerae bacterium]NIU10477.1 hypothetical protein [Phycisphaerae bacterium]NIW17713.1 hypothetical protein [candidate division KSB1 bacterium]NIX30109.1 hypothetical protein [Phycisphaerae bacterium]
MINSIHAGLMVVICLMGCGPGNSSPQDQSSWQKEFNLSERSLVPTGQNEYFILEPGFQLVLQSSNEIVAITVLNETKMVNGVTTRVVEEREWKNGELIEVSRNFFAIDEKTKDIFYFGEEVDDYKRGKVVSHKGEWLAGENGARTGLIMPGEPKMRMRYYQEIAPNVAMDRAKVISLDETFETPAGTFSQCLKTFESTPLNVFEREYKTYAPGIGLIQDERLLLIKYGFTEQK